MLPDAGGRSKPKLREKGKALVGAARSIASWLRDYLIHIHLERSTRYLCLYMEGSRGYNNPVWEAERKTR